MWKPHILASMDWYKGNLDKPVFISKYVGSGFQPFEQFWYFCLGTKPENFDERNYEHQFLLHWMVNGAFWPKPPNMLLSAWELRSLIVIQKGFFSLWDILRSKMAIWKIFFCHSNHMFPRINPIKPDDLGVSPFMEKPPLKPPFFGCTSPSWAAPHLSKILCHHHGFSHFPTGREDDAHETS